MQFYKNHNKTDYKITINNIHASGSFIYSYTISNNCDYNVYIDGKNEWFNKESNKLG